jgi:hypothetical protein
LSNLTDEVILNLPKSCRYVSALQSRTVYVYYNIIPPFQIISLLTFNHNIVHTPLCSKVNNDKVLYFFPTETADDVDKQGTPLCGTSGGPRKKF